MVICVSYQNVVRLNISGQAFIYRNDNNVVLTLLSQNMYNFNTLYGV